MNRPNHALQRTRRERRRCNRCVPCAGSLSLGRSVAYGHHKNGDFATPKNQERIRGVNYGRIKP